MHPTLLILRYTLRATVRGVRAHSFEIFLLGPVIVGGALWVAHRHLGLLRETLPRWLANDTHPWGAPGAVGLGLALLLVALAMPTTFRALYGHRRTDSYLDALPISQPARFHASLVIELVRSIPTLLVLLLLTGAIADRMVPPPEIALDRILRLLAALAVLGLSRFTATLLLAHMHPRPSAAPKPLRAAGRWLIIAAALGLALSAPHPALRLLLLPWWTPAAQLERVFSSALGAPLAADELWSGLGPLAATALVFYLLALGSYLAWHRRDLEIAGRWTLRPRNADTNHLPRRWLQSMGWPMARPIAVQVRRDIKLVLRWFSPAVPLCASFALLALGVVATLLFETDLARVWRLHLALVGSTLAVLATVSLVPFLLKDQLPRFWIEKSTGVDLEQIWKAKLWTAGLLALGPFLVGAIILQTAPGLGDADKAIATLQFAAASWIVTSLVGLAVFEIAAQPLLGLVFGSLVGLALAGLFIFYPQAWWLWAVFYLYVAGQIAGRATRRVRLVEIET